MVYWFESVLLYITSCLVHSYGVDPSCECVVYQSYGLSSGKFYSPNYPQPYIHDIHCILYTFIGDVNEIVEIEFVEMDMMDRKPISPRHTECRDFVKVYHNLDRPEVNENSRADDTLCGNITGLPQKKFYSLGRGLILEFHSDRDSVETHKGFKGVFRFLDKSKFRTDGTLQIGSRCSYDMQSFHNNTRGDFFSPRYPQNYPKMSDCRYLFNGHRSEKVSITFKIIRLPSHQGHRNCETAGDRITVYDGRDNTSNMLEVYCETHRNPEPLYSTGSYMYIEFKTDRRNQLQGFAAEYSFINKEDPIADPSTVGPSRPSGVGDCTKTIESRNGQMEGTVTSPDYPQDYASSMLCKYTFKGEGQQRVQIKFLQMDLHYTGRGAPTDPYQCSDQGDTITVMIYIGEKKKKLGEYCGKKKPPVLMSSGVKMEVIFKSDKKMKSGNSGFMFEYKFRTDFGVLGDGIQDTREVCTFKFRSISNSHGYFTSPNFGGLYPRNTDCRFIFYGGTNEKVQVRFDDFDVDGIRPSCTNGNAERSDSLSFSNYLNSEDRKMPRYCGLSIPEPVQSDSSFFVVTFRSNDVFDATGFKARYNFIQEKGENEGGTPSPMNTSTSACKLTAAPETSVTLLSFLSVVLILKL